MHWCSVYIDTVKFNLSVIYNKTIDKKQDRAVSSKTLVEINWYIFLFTEVIKIRKKTQSQKMHLHTFKETQLPWGDNFLWIA